MQVGHGISVRGGEDFDFRSYFVFQSLENRLHL